MYHKHPNARHFLSDDDLWELSTDMQTICPPISKATWVRFLRRHRYHVSMGWR